MLFLNFYHFLLKILNFLVPKSGHYIYAVPHSNGKNDCYDIINFGSDNLLCVLNYMGQTINNQKITVFLECYNKKRFPEINKYCEKFKKNNLIIVPVYSNGIDKTDTFAKLICKLRNLFIRFRCRYWLTDTIFCNYPEKVGSQKCICLNYCTPFKIAQSNLIKYNYSFIDTVFQTSVLTAMVTSSEYSIKINKFILNGFARNDTLFDSNKKNTVKHWIDLNTDFKYLHIIVYAPTYRDYKNAFKTNCILGYDDPDRDFEKFLDDNNIVIIVKMHPLQEISESLYSKHIIPYKPNYDFSLYDLLCVSDMLISDYSSVIHDYIITGKPVILNFFDRKLYDESRGFAFRPIEYICPGPIVDSLNEMIYSIKNELNTDKMSEKLQTVTEMFHQNIDNKSTLRAANYLSGLINNHTYSEYKKDGFIFK